MTPSIAVQLYSIRVLAKEDFAGTVRKIAAMGYSGVEPWDSPVSTSKAAGDLYKELGLVVPSAHTSVPVGKDKDRILDGMSAIGCKRPVVAGLPSSLFESKDGIKKAADLLNEANQVCHAHGLTLGYHNHYHEFQVVDGRLAYDIFLELVDPAVFFQVDTYWAQVAGIDVPALIKRLGKRVPLLHMKDGPGVKDKPMLALGEGVMDFPAILTAAKGFCEWQIVELDSCATDMLEAVEKSYKYLAGLKI